MPRPAFRSPRWLLGLTLPAALALAGGCDNDTGRADKQVNADLQMAAAAEHGSAAEQAKAHQYLDDAAKDSAASLPLQVRSKALLADAELQSALAVSRTVMANATDITALAREITQQTNAIAADNQLVTALGKYQPDPVLDELKKRSAALAGSDDKPDWVKTDSGTLASVSATDKSAAALQGQIQQLEQQVKTETDQRNDLLTKADQFNEQSEREHQQKSVDLFVQGADARKQASDLAVKIDQDNGQLTRDRADLALLAGQQAALKASAKSLDDRTADVNQSWAAIGEQVKQVKAHSQAQLGDALAEPAANAGGKLPPTISATAEQLAALVKRNAALRAEAETHYNAAIGFYKDAYDRATKLKATLMDPTHLGSDRLDRADRDAWTAEKGATDPAGYRYLQATTQLDRAEFYARAAAEAQTVADLATTVKPVLDAAGLTVPAGLDDANGEAAAAAKSDQTLAATGFKDAVDNFSNLTSGDAPAELKQGATTETMFAQYGWSLLAAASGDTQEAADHMQAAKTARDNAVGENAALPPLPAELAQAATPPPPAGGR